HRKRGEQKGEAERAELGERLEVERVRLLCREPDAALLAPPVGERTGTRARDGMRVRLVHRDAPVLAPDVTPEREWREREPDDDRHRNQGPQPPMRERQISEQR